MPDAALPCTGRPEADLVVAVLADEGIRAVAFADVERGVHGEVVRERVEVRVRADDMARAEAALAAWRAARREAIDPQELERQALAADAPEVEAAVRRASREDVVAREAATGPRCPRCRGAARVGRLARVLAALRGRPAVPRGRRLCVACGHRWDPDEDDAYHRTTGR